MKEAVVHPGPRVEIIDSEIPKPSPTQVLIRVHVSGSNPKDWKLPDWTSKVMNQGDDMAGIITSVGSSIYEFKPGDRVAAMHTIGTPNGAYAEYALAEASLTSHISPSLAFEEAATVPLAFFTAAVALYADLRLPLPWMPATQETPLIVYGGASAVGAFAIKLARAANIHPIIAVAGRGIPFVEKVLDKSKGDRVVDYRDGDESVVKGLKDAIGGKSIRYAFDPTSEQNSYVNIGKVLAGDGTIITVLPSGQEGVPKSITVKRTSVGGVWGQHAEFATAMMRWVFKKIADGSFEGHPYEVVPGGLGGIELGLKNLKAGKASAMKYVFRIAEESDGVSKP